MNLMVKMTFIVKKKNIHRNRMDKNDGGMCYVLLVLG